MKNIISLIVILAVACGPRLSAINAYDYQFMEQNAANTGRVTQYASVPAGGANAMWTLKGNASGYPTPMLSTFGAGLAFDDVNQVVSVALNSGMVTTALGFTPYNATNSSGYIANATGLVTAGTGISLAGSGTSVSPYVVSATGGTGTVTSVSVTTANGVSGSVATSTTTPAITLTLGAITPSSVAAVGTVTGSNLSGTNTGDQTSVTGNAGTVTTINGRIAQGTNVTITGSGTAATPYVIASTDTNSGGTVTSVSAGTGLSGGTITTTGTISMPNTGTAGTYSGVTTDAQGRVTAGTTRTFNNTASKTLVTSAAGQGGVVLDASRDAAVTYSVSTSTTATIGGASSVTVYLEIAATNSATAGDWTAIQTVSNGQTITLAIALSSVQANTLTVSGLVPAGYYIRVRYATTGTASATYVNGQEVKL
jgi:hypothetical protein